MPQFKCSSLNGARCKIVIGALGYYLGDSRVPLRYPYLGVPLSTEQGREEKRRDYTASPDLVWTPMASGLTDFGWLVSYIYLIPVS
jgi:hypothetical protein